MPTSARAVRTVFMGICGEFDGSQRADVGIGPYRPVRNIGTNSYRESYSLAPEEGVQAAERPKNRASQRAIWRVLGASFLPILFWQDRKEWAAGGTVAVSPQKRRSGEYRKRTASVRRQKSRCDAAALPVYFAYSTALVSRMTLTLIWPGYSSSASILRATSCASRIILSSVTSSGLTIIRTSRPA